MSNLYVTLSDLHLHNWSAFATTLSNGVNSRLQGLLDEIERAGRELKARGGSVMVIPGDLFHVRGNIAPSVLNPALDTFRKLRDMGIEVHLIPGNHDLEGKEAQRVSSAITSLEQLGCVVYNEARSFFVGTQRVLMVPWVESVVELKSMLIDIVHESHTDGDDLSGADLIIHAPVNGVIMGIPDHGLEPAWLKDLGFRNVISGHYHNHKDFGNVYSAGALAHHTWSDVGTTAGFMLVGDKVEHFDSILPKFVEVHQDTPAADIPKIARSNYVRVKVETSKTSDIEAMRQYMINQGALGVIIISVKKPTEERGPGATIKAGASVSASVVDFINTMKITNQGDVQRSALRILAEAGAA